MLGVMLQTLLKEEKALTTQVIKTEFKSLAIPHRQIIFLITQNNCLHIHSCLKKKNRSKCFLIHDFASTLTFRNVFL